MPSLLAMDIIDIARSLQLSELDPTPKTVKEWLTAEYAGRPKGGFDYDPANRVVFDAYRGGHTAQSAVDYCLENGNPAGRRQNALAVKCVMPHILKHPSRCYRIGNSMVAIGRFSGKTTYARIKAPLLRVESSTKAYVVMTGFRMSHRPQRLEVDFACSVARDVFAQGVYSEADFEYLNAGPSFSNPKRRFLRVAHGVERARYDRDEIDYYLDIFVKGLALMAKAGADVSAPSFRGYRLVDPDRPRFL